jgi:cytochrome c oxidase cbb3-type subunit 3
MKRLLILATIACGSADAAQTPQQQQWGASAPFVQHPDHIQPGMGLTRPFMTVTNPYEGNADRAAEGGRLFIAYNCLDCHGAEGSGAMGPSLQDSRWHFGGSNGEVFQSIYEGRPDGMPAWGGRISDADIWRLVTYVRGLNKGHQVATENFTGKTVERTGH